jgi:hypothetical protein
MNQINIPREFETSSMVCLQRETTDFYAGAKLEGGVGGVSPPPPKVQISWKIFFAPFPNVREKNFRPPPPTVELSQQ